MSFAQFKHQMTKQEALWFLAWSAQRRKIFPSGMIWRSYFQLQRAIQRHEGFHFSLEGEFGEWNDFFLATPASEWRLFLERVQKSLSRGRQVIYPGHSFFPHYLLELEALPFLLHVEGAPIWMGLPGIAVVGSREPSRESLQWMDEHLGQFLKETPCFTVSGGARGVDQAAHRISLRHKTPTVAFVPSGLNRLYPESLAELREQILADGGALVSEFDLDQPMAKHHFAQRNRLIAGLGELTLVIEARKRSGTLLTARETIEQGKALLVLPTHPLDHGGRGSLDLLFEGATPVRDADDLKLYFESELSANILHRKPEVLPLGGDEPTLH
jgi:DNA processing protein